MGNRALRASITTSCRARDAASDALDARRLRSTVRWPLEYTIARRRSAAIRRAIAAGL